MTNSSFAVIGENIHTTRVLRTDGKRVGEDENGRTSVKYRDINRAIAFMDIPDSFKETQVYRQGRVKHFMIAVSNGINGNSEESEVGRRYIVKEVEKQIKANSKFLDLNVDEIS